MKRVDLHNEKINTLVLKYMLPSVIGMLGLSMCIFLDTMFVGRGIGNLGLAALNVGIPIYSLFNSIGMIFGVGGATALAISLGKKRYNSADEIFTFSMVASLFIGIIITIIGVVFLEEIAILLGASIETLPLVKDYLGVVLSTSVAFIIIITLGVFVRNDGNPKLAMWAVVFSNITNIVLDYIFIMPLEMGMRGAALATAIAQFVGIGVLLLHFILKKNKIKLVIKKISLRYAKRIFINGTPSFVTEISTGAVIFIFNVVIGRISGDVALSAYSIIANVALVFTAIFNGISQGIQPIIGVNYGAKNINRVLETYKITKKIAFISGLVFFIIGVVKPRMLVLIFSTNSSEVMEIATQGIKLYFAAFIFMGINVVNIGFLQYIEKSKVSTVISFIRGFVLTITIISLFSKFFGITGVWITVPVVEIITLIISTILIKKDEERFRIE